MPPLRVFTLPNFITCLNLVCGVMALGALAQGYWLESIWLVLLAAVLDVLDGAVARMTGQTSAIGKDLDSLADVVSFGVVPAAWAVYLLAGSQVSAMFIPGWHWLGLIIAPSSALRLAKFNHDTRQTTGFIGLPTPANALLWGGLLYSSTVLRAWLQPELSQMVLVALTLFSAYVLHAPLPLLSFKFKPGGWAANRFIYILILGIVVLAAWLQLHALVPALLWYMVLSVAAPKS